MTCACGQSFTDNCVKCYERKQMKSIDWTKPIRHIELGRVTLIGKDGDDYVIKRSSMYGRYTPEGKNAGGGGGDRVWIENIPDETVVYAYSSCYRDGVMVGWCYPDKVEWVKKEYKNCLLSMQKVVLKEGDICGS